MKDKSRFISSVIVSLLAGFICYQFGGDIKQNIQRAVLSSNDSEMYLPTGPLAFNSTIIKSGSKSIKKNSRFYLKKKNTIEIRTKDSVIPGEELLSNFLIQNQARIKKATPDKKIDFTAELQNLVNNDNLNKSVPRQSREIKGIKSFSNSNLEVAEKNFSKSGNYKIRFEESQKKNNNSVGKGFEYNFVIEKNTSGSQKNINKNVNKSKTSDCEVKYNEKKEVKVEVKTNVKNEKKVKVITPKVYIKSGDKVKEVIIPENNCDGDSM